MNKKTLIFSVLIFATGFLFCSNQAQAGSKEYMDLCKQNKSIDLSQFENRKAEKLNGETKEKLVAEILAKAKIREILQNKKTGKLLSSSVYKTLGENDAEKYVFGIVFEEGILNYIFIKDTNTKPIDYVSFLNDNETKSKIYNKKFPVSKGDFSYSDQLISYPEKPQHITVECTGCAGAGESQQGRTRKDYNLHLDSVCYAEMYHSCITQPECVDSACLAGCSAGATAYCTYREEFCTECNYIPSFSEFMGSVW